MTCEAGGCCVRGAALDRLVTSPKSGLPVLAEGSKGGSTGLPYDAA
ncbi:MAG: hypothetical protein ACLPSH_18925 [Vulcanimicrobiaceae bacterium]